MLMVGKVSGSAAGEHDAALDGVDQRRDVAVAGIVVAEGVGDRDDRPVERVVGKPHRLDEGAAEKEGKIRVAVVGQSLLEPPATPRHRPPKTVPQDQVAMRLP